MERLTYKGTVQMTEDGLVTPSYSDYSPRRIIEKLAEYEDAEEQGLLLRLPVPIGTTVYGFYRQIWIDAKGCRDCIYYCFDGCDYEEEQPACMKVVETKFEFDMRDNFGKTIFLIKEEAENALVELGK